MRAFGTALLICAASLLGSAAAAAGAEGAPALKASGGFDAPRRLATIDRSGGSRIAVIGGDAPRALWERPDGVWAMPLATTGDGDGAGPRALVRSRGVRDVAGGVSGGDGVWAWVERDLQTGRYRLRWTWRGEGRTAWEGTQPPEPTLVRGGDRPELVVRRSVGGRHVLDHVAWDGARQRLHETDLRVRGLDALRSVAGLHVGWLEGETDTALGRVRSDWDALLLTGGGNGPLRLGAADARDDGDALRLGRHQGRLLALWTGSQDVLRWAPAGEAPRPLGRGRPVGFLGDAWFWVEGITLWRAAAGDPAAAVPVVRLPAAPTGITGVEAGGTRWLAWVTGRFEGGLEVWAVDDRQAFQPDWRDHLAARMGWDPWRFWASLTGQALTSVLIGVLVTLVLTPFYWIAAVLLARRPAATEPSRQALGGAVLGTGSLLALAVVAAWVSPHGAASLPQVTGGVTVTAPVLLGAGGLTWAARRRADTEPALGLLSGAWLATVLASSLWIFATFQAWQAAWPGLA